MKIYLHEITDLDSEFEFTQEEKWVLDAVRKVDEEGARPLPGSKAANASRPVHAHFSLHQVDGVVVVNGEVSAPVKLLCSRCANPFDLKCEHGFSALFCKDPVMAGVAHLDGAKPAGQNQGHARHAHDFSKDNEPGHAGAGGDLDITYLSEEYIDLAEVLTEQLQLQIPFQPLCRENCKGICANCGADQNVGRCACSKLVTASPFAVLKNIKAGLKASSS